MNETKKQKAHGMLTALANGITEDNINNRLLSREGDILGKAKKHLAAFFEELILLFNLIKDYKNGHYPNVPWKFIACASGAILYFFMPIDAIPDFIPFAGYIDDASVVGIVLSMFKSDMNAYKVWKAEHNEPILIGAQITEYADPDSEKFDLLEKHKTYVCEELTYENIISKLISMRPNDPDVVKASVLRADCCDECVVIVTTYMNGRGDMIWGNDPENPYGWIYKACRLDEELNNAFADEDMIVFE